jgi:hypothetical protein
MTVKRIIQLFVVTALMAVAMAAGGLPAYALPNDEETSYSHSIGDAAQCYIYCTNADYFGTGTAGGDTSPQEACGISCGYAPSDYPGPTDGSGNPITLPAGSTWG